MNAIEFDVVRDGVRWCIYWFMHHVRYRLSLVGLPGRNEDTGVLRCPPASSRSLEHGSGHSPRAPIMPISSLANHTVIYIVPENGHLNLLSGSRFTYARGKDSSKRVSNGGMEGVPNISISDINQQSGFIAVLHESGL